MDYYKRYMGDYGRDTGHLSMEEHGAYMLLLDHYYSRKKPLPGEILALCRLCRATTKAEQTAVKTVVEEFFPLAPDGLRHNKRADEEIQKWEEIVSQASAAGKASAEARRKTHPNGNGRSNERTNGRSTEPSTETSTDGVTDVQRTHQRRGQQNFNPPDPIPAPIPKPLPEPDPTSESELETRTRASLPRGKPVRAAELLSASRNGEKNGTESEAEILKRTVVAMLQAGSSPDEIVRTMPSRDLTVEQIAQIQREAAS